MFSNFQAPAVLPFSHPQGALPNDASDIAVATVTKPDGRIGLVFTPINPATSALQSLFINAQRGATAPGNLVRNITFDVTSSNPQQLLHSLTLGHGAGSNSNADASVANIGYYVEPGTGLAGLIIMDTLNTPQLTATLPGGDLASFRFGDELELTSNHNRGGSVGTATIDTFEMTFTLVPSGSAPPPVLPIPSFVGTNAMLGGSTSSGSVTLNAPAQAGGALVTLTSANPLAASIPATVTVPQGAFTANFPITAAPAVAPGITVGLTASYNGTTINGFVQIFPAPPLAVAQVTVSPTATVGGTPVQGVITLNIPAQSSPATVTLASGNPAVLSVPASVDVPVGASTVSFQAATLPVNAATSVPVTASLNGTSVSASVTVNPVPAPPAAVYTLSISRSGSGTVTAMPNGIDRALSCGNTCTASYNQGTVVTLTAVPPAGKTVGSWGGACSGSSLSCTVAINNNTAVQVSFK